jgi:hypothetical protein
MILKHIIYTPRMYTRATITLMAGKAGGTAEYRNYRKFDVSPGIVHQPPP